MTRVGDRLASLVEVVWYVERWRLYAWGLGGRRMFEYRETHVYTQL
jgi:hypothetical protein